MNLDMTSEFLDWKNTHNQGPLSTERSDPVVIGNIFLHLVPLWPMPPEPLIQVRQLYNIALQNPQLGQ